MTEPRDYMVDVVLRMFDAGMDTLAIAEATKKPQADVERWLHKGLEQRRSSSGGAK